MSVAEENRVPIFVVDDDLALLDSMKMLLSLQGFRPVTHASASSFLTALPHVNAGAVLIDVNMPGGSGVDLLERLKSIGFNLPCIMMTGLGQVSVAVRAMKAGAFDFIEKPFENEALLALLRRAIDTAGHRKPGSEREAGAKTRIGALTPRERDVLMHLARGEPNKIIAFELGISPRTVEIHRARLMEKLSAGSVAEVVRLAIDAGVVS